jgi:F-type H+-transporting ATPase subunit b
MELHPLDILYHVINIVVLYVLLRLILYKPIRKFMNERADRIQKQIENAAALEKAAADEKAEFDQWIAGAEENVKRIIAEGEQKAALKAEEIIDAANKQAEQIILEARKAAQDETKKIMEKMQDQITDAAVSIAGKLLKREVSLQDNLSVVDEFFAQIED